MDALLDISTEADEEDVEFLSFLVNELQGIEVKEEDVKSQRPKPENEETKFHTLENLNPSVEYYPENFAEVKYEYEEILYDFAEIQPLNMDNIVTPVTNVQINDDIFALDEQIRNNIILSRDLAAEAETVFQEKLKLQREREDLAERITKFHHADLDSKLKRALKKKGQDCMKICTSQLQWTLRCRFGIPYFKTVHRFPASWNQDFKEIIDNKEVMFFRLPRYQKVSLRLQRRIETTILNQLKRKRINHLETLLKQVSETADCDSDQKKSNLTEAIDLAETVKDIRETRNWNIPVDFHALGDDRRFNSDDYQRIWTLLGDRFTEEFSSDELTNLKSLARLYCGQYWDRIATLLGTGRSGYGCFLKWIRLPREEGCQIWTPQENDLLCKLCGKLDQIKDQAVYCYYWRHIRRQFPRRTKSQIQSHWKNVLQPSLKKGRFTEEESQVLEHFKQEGKSFPRIASIMQTRSSVQLRSHYNHIVSRVSCNSGEWTEAEEDKLNELICKYGPRNWKKISEELGTRTRSQCRSKLATLWSKDENEKFTDLSGKYGPNFEKISAELGTKSMAQCRRKYYFNNPGIKRGSWSRKENKLFESLLPEWKNDFKRISLEMQTRTEEQCRLKYEKMQEQEQKLKKREHSRWTVRERRKFKNLMQIHGSDIEKIYTDLETKSLQQCFNMYKKMTLGDRKGKRNEAYRPVTSISSSMKPLVAPMTETSSSLSLLTAPKMETSSSLESIEKLYWTDNDKRMFEELVEVHGSDMEKICASMKTKTLKQCRSMYKRMMRGREKTDFQNLLMDKKVHKKKINQYWSASDQRKFKELILIHGSEIDKIWAVFPTRSLNECYNMYKRLSRTEKKNVCTLNEHFLSRTKVKRENSVPSSAPGKDFHPLSGRKTALNWRKCKSISNNEIRKS